MSVCTLLFLQLYDVLAIATMHLHVHLEPARCRVAAALGASDLTISNENRQIPSGARLTADADADRPSTEDFCARTQTHLRASGCARVKRRTSYLSPFEREACARSGLTVRSDRVVRRAMEKTLLQNCGFSLVQQNSE